MSIWDPGPDYNFGRWPFYPTNLGQALAAYCNGMILRPYEKVTIMERKVQKQFRTQFHTEGARWGAWKDEYEGHEYSSDLNYQFRTTPDRGPGLYYTGMDSGGSAEVRYWNRDPGSSYAKVTP